MNQETHASKLTTLSLHRGVCALPISPCCYKGAESISLPGVQLPGLRASSLPAQPGQPHRSRGVRPFQADCRVAVAVAPTMGPLCLICAHGWDTLAPPWQDQPGGHGVCADPVTISIQPHCHPQSLQGSRLPRGCITTAQEICFVMLFLHYFTTE